jgi:hypothetical protein
MTANTNLERRVAEHYANEAPLRAPDRVLHAALATIDTTKQRRGLLAPWRFTKMPTYAKLAAAAAVIAVVAFGVWQVAPGPGPGGPSATPTPSPSPTAASTAVPGPTTQAYVPPELTETFTSDIHGITISYPAGWTAQAATEPVTEMGFINFGRPQGDFLYDPARTDHLFLVLASEPIGDASVETWSADILAADECTSPMEPVVVDGADGMIAPECGAAFVSRGGRGYMIWLYVSGDDSDLRAWDALAWFDEVLASVQLRPQTATD